MLSPEAEADLRRQMREAVEAFARLQSFLMSHYPSVPKGEGIEQWAINALVLTQSELDKWKGSGQRGQIAQWRRDSERLGLIAHTKTYPWPEFGGSWKFRYGEQQFVAPSLREVLDLALDASKK